MSNAINLFDVANNGKSLKRYVNGTLEKYNNAFVALHNAACMTVWHAAQFGECSHLNAFYNGLKVNDRTALRVWIGKHFPVPVEGEEKPYIWLNYSTSPDANGIATNKDGAKIKGFYVATKSEKHRKDVYSLDELLAGPKFFDKNVKDKDAIDLPALLSMLAKAMERGEKQSDENGIALPDDLVNAMATVKEKAVKYMPSKSNLN